MVGFAAETDDLMANAQGKLTRKNADWIVASTDVSPTTGIMGGTENAVHLVSAAGIEDLAAPRQGRRRPPPGPPHRRGADLTADPPWLIRSLRQTDLPQFKTLRLQGLREHPEAFGSSLEEEQDRDLSPPMIGEKPNVTLGGFAADALWSAPRPLS